LFVVLLLRLERAWLVFKALSAGENLAGKRALGVSLAEPETAFLLNHFHVTLSGASGCLRTRSSLVFRVNLLLANA
jgi:hypothetical protein